MKLKELMEKYGEYDVVVSRSITTNEIMINGRKPKPKTVWDLEIGDKYVLLFGSGEVAQRQLSDKTVDYCYLEAGNVFLTKEEANKEFERRKVETLLLKYGGRRWFKEHKLNWFIALENEVSYEPYVYSVSNRPKQGCIYFDTEEQAEKAISEIGKERLKKALFEVRE